MWWLDTYKLPPREVEELPAGTYARAKDIHNLIVQAKNDAQERANRR